MDVRNVRLTDKEHNIFVQKNLVCVQSLEVENCYDFSSTKCNVTFNTLVPLVREGVILGVLKFDVHNEK
jgi:hypothetical protein